MGTDLTTCRRCRCAAATLPEATATYRWCRRSIALPNYNGRNGKAVAFFQVRLLLGSIGVFSWECNIAIMNHEKCTWLVPAIRTSSQMNSAHNLTIRVIVNYTSNTKSQVTCPKIVCKHVLLNDASLTTIYGEGARKGREFVHILTRHTPLTLSLGANNIWHTHHGPTINYRCNRWPYRRAME